MNNESNTEIKLNPDQTKAVDYSVNKSLSIVTGGAGTGKTTLVKEIIEQTKNGKSQLALCCPTGKAAARLREATERDTSTIHRLLGYNGRSFSVKSLSGLHLIIDEASMVDSSLMAEIIRRNPDRLTLIGDAAQLPPVGNGQPFHDMVNLRPDLTAKLTICYRASEAIYKAGAAVREGLQPETAQSENEWFEMRGTGDMDATWKYLETLIDAGEIDFQKDIVVCCKNDHVQEINKRMVAKFGRTADDAKWAIGDRIICLKNFASSDIWNGTTGTISAIDTQGRAWVKGDIPFWDAEKGEYVQEAVWGKAILQESQHAYSLTVHKSQGSQYRKVFFAAIQGGPFVHRALVYTAITRAKKECHVIGNIAAFRNGINKVASKWTVLQELARRQKISSK
ncbi:MAG: hypothetical protein A2020_12315 [Lentisphaerae bacterium GWF2_45_14]|nr:MAG: hypothetical protein A2020_12315 [Lentisphaerae bacterium GWF2_45_14]